MLASLYELNPMSTSWVAGGAGEARALLGTPLPLLPPPELEAEGQVFCVRFLPELRTQLQRFLQGLLVQLGISPVAAVVADAAREEAEYESTLVRALVSVRGADRRLGLLNLFWLAHTKDAALALRDMEARSPSIRKLKYSLHPLLASFYRRAEQAARREAEKADPVRAAFLAGSVENPALVESLIEDGFAFTEPSLADLDLAFFLTANKRYRISAELFAEVHAILVKEVEQRLRQSDRGLLARIVRHVPGLAREEYAAATPRIALNSHVLAYLLADAWGTGARLLASPKLKLEADRRKAGELVDAFLDFVSGLKRFEIVSGLRERVSLVDNYGDRDFEEKAARGLRHYAFGEAAQVLNNAVNATVLFLDLRGFTKTSEGYISEGDLTRELYAVFDAFVPHVLRFGGTVDKFLGDGIMITFGTGHAGSLDPLDALRVAVLCQDTLAALRREGKTGFRMGIAIHYGRVYVARFIADDEQVQNTVIGRNVNLAGRLSSAAKKPMDEDEGSEPEPVRAGLSVTVDASGTLFNEGIAISRDTLVQLQTHMDVPRPDDESPFIMQFRDESVGRTIRIRYAGDAKFKGVRSSFPVYEVRYE